MDFTGLSAYIRPDEVWGIGGSVTGTVDSDYLPGWIIDGRPRRPVRGASGALSLSISGASGDIGIVAVAHHNLIVPVTIGGDVTATITPEATRPPNGISLSPFALVDPVETSVTTITVAATGNDENVVIGELVAGNVRSLIPVMIQGAQFKHDDFSDDARVRRGVLGYATREEGRVLSGSQYFTTDQLEDIKAWWQAQQGGSLTSYIVPDPDVNDLWAVKFVGLQYEPAIPALGAGLWLVNLTFIEVPRVRW